MAYRYSKEEGRLITQTPKQKIAWEKHLKKKRETLRKKRAEQARKNFSSEQARYKRAIHNAYQRDITGVLDRNIKKDNTLTEQYENYRRDYRSKLHSVMSMKPGVKRSMLIQDLFEMTPDDEWEHLRALLGSPGDEK